MQILVTGASGNLGSMVIETILKIIPALNIYALVREPNKMAEIQEKGIHVFQGDYDHVSAHESANGRQKPVLVKSVWPDAW